MQPLRILITNNSLGPRGGTEMYVRDLAHALMKRGHNPVAYSPVLGETAEVLRGLTVPVVDNLADLAVAPDIIHGHHHHETMTAAMQFPDTPIVSVCHGWVPWPETPVVHPAIMKHVAVDELCRERLLMTPDMDADHVDCIYNFVDCSRFAKVRTLPERPRKAFVFTNYAGRVPGPIEEACREMGIEQVDLAGLASKNSMASPENNLPAYDVVFAKARAAIEAMASGCAVVVTHLDGVAGMVTPENLPELRKLNFGVRTMKRQALSKQAILDALGQYDPDRCAQVTRTMREQATLELAADQWEAVYSQALDRWARVRASVTPAMRYAATANYLRSIAGFVKEARTNKRLVEVLRDTNAQLKNELERANDPAVSE